MIDHKQANQFPQMIDDKQLLSEVILATCSALAEQLDVDRAIIAIKRQHDAYAASGAPRADEVADILFRIGAALTHIADCREAKKTDKH